MPGLDATTWRLVSPLLDRALDLDPVPAAIVDLPVEGPALLMREGDPVPPHVGPRTADLLKYLTAMDITIVPFALLARAEYEDMPARTLQHKALQLAHAIVADANAQSAS